MIKFNEINFDEFKELIEFLKFNDEEGEYHNITKRLTRFIEGVDAIQSVILDNLISEILKNEESAEESFNNFKEQYPDLNFDPDGKLDMTDINYFELALQTCDMLFNQSKERIENNTAIDMDKQIYNAKTLDGLKNITEDTRYTMRRVLYFKKNKNINISADELTFAEECVRLLLPDNWNKIMGKFLFYIYNKSYEKCNFFIEHFLYRLDILVKDSNLEHPSNREFFDNLKAL